MNRRAELKAKLKSLDEQISKFREEYVATSYLAFIEKGGCVFCDGCGMNVSLGITIKCIVCNGETPTHVCSFYKANNDIYSVDYDKESKYRHLYGSVPVYENRTYFYTNEADTQRQELLNQRELTYRELISLPDSDDNFSLGDTVKYAGKEYTVVWYSDGQLAIKNGQSRSQDVRSGQITVNVEDVELVSKLNDKLPVLTGVSRAQRNYGYACRSAAITQGQANADLCLKQTTAKFWIEKFKNICPPRSGS